jgi:hypothetical protein
MLNALNISEALAVTIELALVRLRRAAEELVSSQLVQGNCVRHISRDFLEYGLRWLDYNLLWSPLPAALF